MISANQTLVQEEKNIHHGVQDTDNLDDYKPKDAGKNEYAHSNQKSPAWLSCELRLDEFNIRNQAFTVTGWINVFWEWKAAPAKLQKYDGVDDYDADANNDPNDVNKEDITKMIIFQNTQGEKVVKVMDLRQSSLSYYLPIDVTKIFFQPSLQSIKFIEPPFMLYNQDTHMTHTQYYITASLLENLELFLYPFDQQFLNLKLRWNVDYYRILDFQNEKDMPTNSNWFGKDAKDISCKRKLELFHQKPLQIQLKETIQHEVEMFPAWIDFRNIKRYRKKTDKDRAATDDKGNKIAKTTNLRFALIRMRVSRNPMYFITNVIFPFFVIVSCSFSVYAVPSMQIGDRLAVSVTILLTFTAFQNFISEQLPETSAMLLIDWYITTAYTLQALIILQLCISSMIARDGDDDLADFVDYICGGVLGLYWVLFSLFYISLRSKLMLNCYDKICCCFCCCSRINFADWEKRSIEEMEDWTVTERKVYCYNKILRESN